MPPFFGAREASQIDCGGHGGGDGGDGGGYGGGDGGGEGGGEGGLGNTLAVLPRL